jgi:hypothetical protein
MLYVREALKLGWKTLPLSWHLRMAPLGIRVVQEHITFELQKNPTNKHKCATFDRLRF